MGVQRSTTTPSLCSLLQLALRHINGSGFQWSRSELNALHYLRKFFLTGTRDRKGVCKKGMNCRGSSLNSLCLVTISYRLHTELKNPAGGQYNSSSGARWEFLFISVLSIFPSHVCWSLAPLSYIQPSRVPQQSVGNSWDPCCVPYRNSRSD